MHIHGWCCGGDGRRWSVLAIVGMVVGGLAFAAALALAFGWVVMMLWNWLMPTLFGLPVISYAQAWGLVLLSHILFKGGHWGGGPARGKRHARHDGPFWKRCEGDGDEPAGVGTREESRPEGGA